MLGATCIIALLITGSTGLTEKLLFPFPFPIQMPMPMPQLNLGVSLTDCSGKYNVTDFLGVQDSVSVSLYKGELEGQSMLFIKTREVVNTTARSLNFADKVKWIVFEADVLVGNVSFCKRIVVLVAM